MRLCIRKISGEEVANLDAFELQGGDVRALKVHLQPKLGASRFRLRLLCQGDLLADSQALADLDRSDLQVVILQFRAARAEEVQALLAASREDLVGPMEGLLEQPLDPNLAEDGDTALATAARNGSAECARLLLEAGADRDRSFRGASPLWLAAARRHWETARVLLDAGADIDLANEGASPLWFAARRGHFDIVQLLLEAGANVERRSVSGSSPLWIVAAKGHLEVVRLLLHADADTGQAHAGATPMQMAISRGHLEVVHLLHDTGQKEAATGPGIGLCTLDAARLLQKAAMPRASGPSAVMAGITKRLRTQ